jgi:threonine 3-dehydrogenase
LFSIAVAKACGAARVFATDVNAHRRRVALEMGADLALDPTTDDVEKQILEATGGTGVDVLLEMSGHPEAMRLGFALLRTGGRASLLGIPSRPFELDFARDIIFKGATVQGINGRKMFETWFQMEALLATGKLNLEPVITHRLKLSEFEKAMELLQSGEAIKVVMRPE